MNFVPFYVYDSNILRFLQEDKNHQWKIIISVSNIEIQIFTTGSCVACFIGKFVKFSKMFCLIRKNMTILNKNPSKNNLWILKYSNYFLN